MGDVDKLSRAREAMSELFPLSPTMWRQWIKDELSLNTAARSFSLSLTLIFPVPLLFLTLSLYLADPRLSLEF